MPRGPERSQEIVNRLSSGELEMTPDRRKGVSSLKYRFNGKRWVCDGAMSQLAARKLAYIKVLLPWEVKLIEDTAEADRKERLATAKRRRAWKEAKQQSYLRENDRLKPGLRTRDMRGGMKSV